MMKHAFLLAFFLVACSMSTTVKAQTPSTLPAAGNRPNIILLFVDDLGWNDLGYRNPKFETPNIDQLASQSVDFERAYVPSPTCSPSRAGLLTGQHPARLGFVRHIPTSAKKARAGFDEFGRTQTEWSLLETDPAQFPSRNWLPLECITYAEALKKLGYANHFVGKWHLGHEEFHPIQQGFDTQYGTTNFGHPKSYNAPFFENSGTLDGIKEGHLTDVLTDQMVKFILDADLTEPFMLSLWYYGVHRPAIGRPDLVRYFEEKGYMKDDAIYAAQIKAVDESVGRIRQALRDAEIAEDTVILFTSDQGSLYSNAPLRGNKRADTLCEGGARVPMLIHYPIDKDSRTPVHATQQVVQTTDLFPTLVEIAGGSADEYSDLEGVSLLSLVRDQQPLTRQTPVIGYRAYEDLYASVRRDNWNLLAYRDGRVCLYDVVKDIDESEDVAAENPEVVSALKEELISWEKGVGVANYSGFQSEHAKAIAPPAKHLYGAKLLRRRLEETDPSREQLEAFDRLSYQYTADVMVIRERAGIDKGLIRTRDEAYKKLIKTDLEGDEFWIRLQEETGISDQQRTAFRETKERSNRFKAEARKLFGRRTGKSKQD